MFFSQNQENLHYFLIFFAKICIRIHKFHIFAFDS